MPDENYRVSFTATDNVSETALRMANAVAKTAVAVGDADGMLRKLQQTLVSYAATGDTSISMTNKNAAAAEKLALSSNLVQRAAAGEAQAMEQLAAAQGRAIEMNKTFNAQQERAAASAQAAAEKQKAAGSGGGILGDGITNAGYELLVAGAAMQRFGQLVYGGVKTVVDAAVQYEREFASVIRTTNDGSVSMASLRQQLIGISQEIPVSFKDVASIAALGGQLGIAGSGIASFTKVVAELSATTNLTIDAAGTALGRFQAILGVPSKEFENLASSILKVGVNSVATETQIVGIATQISSMAHYAGFTAEQVVGLAGALGSVGAAPELSRGTITRTFSLMANAVSSGSNKLSEFAAVSGVTAEQFKQSFGTDKFAPVFQSFLAGLGNMAKTGGDAHAQLNQLGITSVRDVPLLLRLAGATDVVTRAFLDSASGYSQATELARQQGIISETTASKITTMQNSFQNLLATLGNSVTGPLSDFVTVLQNAFTGLQALTATNAGQSMAAFGIVITAIIGILLTLFGAAGLAAGTLLLIANAGDRVGVSLETMAAKVGIAELSMNGLKTASSGLFATLGPLALAATALGLVFENAPQIQDWILTITSAGAAVEDARRRITGSGSINSNLSDRIAADTLFGPVGGILGSIGSNNTLNDLVGKDAGTVGFTRGFGAVGGFGDISKLDNSMKKLIDGGQVAEANRQFTDLSAKFLAMGGTQEVLNAAFPNTSNGLKQVSADSLNAAIRTKKLADEQKTLGNILGLSDKELATYAKSLEKNYNAETDLGGALKEAQANMKAWAEAQAKATGSSKAKWQNFYDGVSVNLKDYNDILEKNQAATKNWNDNLLRLVGAGATANEIDQLTKLGPEKAGQLVQQAVDDLKGQGARFITDLSLQGAAAASAYSTAFIKGSAYITQAAAQGGTAASQAMTDALISGVPGAVDQVVAQFHLKLDGYVGTPTVSLTQMETDLENMRQRQSLKRVTIYVDASTAKFAADMDALRSAVASTPISVPISVPGQVGPYAPGFYQKPIYRAAGGSVYGAGSSTSDSIPAMLSSGEYVIRAASVRQYGNGLFDALNRGVAHFASGGPVGAPSLAGMIGSGIIELGPKSLAVLRAAVSNDVILSLDPQGVARLSREGNRQLANQGMG